MTGGYPILLQHAGYILSQSERDIDINTFTAKFKDQTEQIFKNIWRDLTTEEQNLLKLIVINNLNGEVGEKLYSVDDIDKVIERNSYNLKTLEQQGVIYKDLDYDKYKFSSSLMQDLVVQEFDDLIPRKREVLFEKFGIKIQPYLLKSVRGIIKAFGN
ncbi:MAG: hypothetical protein F6K40_27870 [Okeania sp. SIO3I5]|uniref:hypothetical protein n=1 Tax=Okeania sp. SIO3I5 TaxID=2607805 RepID=UPI0013B78E26|nr:hypothetical protein [Okeania sp. SIO3I5]NEQ39860.1 hypothetical protein [Okeania sp. SIO3I5]